MFRRWNREACLGIEVLVIDQSGMIAPQNAVSDFFIEALRPVVGSAAPHGLQVVNDVATADQQHLFLAQCREAFAEIVVESRRLRPVDTELPCVNTLHVP